MSGVQQSIVELSKKLDPEIISYLLTPPSSSGINGISPSLVKIPLAIVGLISQYQVSLYDLAEHLILERDEKVDGVRYHILAAQEVEKSWLKDLFPYLSPATTIQLTTIYWRNRAIDTNRQCAEKLGICRRQLDEYAVSGFYSHIAHLVGLNVMKIQYGYADSVKMKNFKFYAESLGYGQISMGSPVGDFPIDRSPVIRNQMIRLGLMRENDQLTNFDKNTSLATSWGNASAQCHSGRAMIRSRDPTLIDQGFALYRASMRQGHRPAAYRIFDAGLENNFIDAEVRQWVIELGANTSANAEYYTSCLLTLHSKIRWYPNSSPAMLLEGADYLRKGVEICLKSMHSRPLRELISNMEFGKNGFVRDVSAACTYLQSLLSKSVDCGEISKENFATAENLLASLSTKYKNSIIQ